MNAWSYRDLQRAPCQQDHHPASRECHAPVRILSTVCRPPDGVTRSRPPARAPSPTCALHPPRAPLPPRPLRPRGKECSHPRGRGRRERFSSWKFSFLGDLGARANNLWLPRFSSPERRTGRAPHGEGPCVRGFRPRTSPFPSPADGRGQTSGGEHGPAFLAWVRLNFLSLRSEEPGLGAGDSPPQAPPLLGASCEQFALAPRQAHWPLGMRRGERNRLFALAPAAGEGEVPGPVRRPGVQRRGGGGFSGAGFAGEGEVGVAGQVGGHEVVEDGDVFLAAGGEGLGGDQLPGGAAGFGEEVFGAGAQGVVDAGGVAEGDPAQGGDVAQDDQPGVAVFPEAVGPGDVGAPAFERSRKPGRGTAAARSSTTSWNWRVRLPSLVSWPETRRRPAWARMVACAPASSPSPSRCRRVALVTRVSHEAPRRAPPPPCAGPPPGRRRSCAAGGAGG